MTAAFPPPAVRRLLEADERFESVPADPSYARLVLDAVIDEECELALVAASRDQWTKTNTLTYDAARKAVEALLLSAGWRVRATAGAHAGVVEVVRLWLGDGREPGPRISAKFSASRKARHEDEYPDPRSRGRQPSELRTLAQDNVRLVNLVRERLDLEPVARVVPTDENIAAFGG